MDLRVGGETQSGMEDAEDEVKLSSFVYVKYSQCLFIRKL